MPIPLPNPAPTHLTRDPWLAMTPLPLFCRACGDHATSYRHDHAFFELALVLAGTAEHVSSAGRDPLRAGSLVALRPGAWHVYEQLRDKFTVFDLGLAPELLRNELAWTRHDTRLSHLLWDGPVGRGRFGVLVTAVPVAAMAGIVDAMQVLNRLTAPAAASGAHPAVTHPAITMGALLTVLGRVADALPGDLLSEEGIPGPPRPESSRKLHPAVMNAVELLEQHPRHPWSLDELARRVCRNSCYFVRRFHTDTGLTPMAFLNRARGERAATLLVQTAKEIREIGDAVGWPDPRHFARRFKSQFGISGSEYRRRFAGPAREQHPADPPDL